MTTFLTDGMSQGMDINDLLRNSGREMGECLPGVILKEDHVKKVGIHAEPPSVRGCGVWKLRRSKEWLAKGETLAALVKLMPSRGVSL